MSCLFCFFRKDDFKWVHTMSTSLPHSAEKAPTFRYGDESAHQAQLFTKTFLKNK